MEKNPKMEFEKHEITLCGILYTVGEHDGQVIFTGADGIITNQFAFEWCGLFWQLVFISDSKIMVSHIEAAHKWVRDNYVENWIDGTATVQYNADSLVDVIKSAKSEYHENGLETLAGSEENFVQLRVQQHLNGKVTHE